MSETLLRMARKMKAQANEISKRGSDGFTSTELSIRTTRMIVLDTVADEIFAALKDTADAK